MRLYSVFHIVISLYAIVIDSHAATDGNIGRVRWMRFSVNTDHFGSITED